VVIVVVALAVAGCGSGTTDEPASAGGPDASQLVAQLSDLPAGYDFVPAESFPVPTERVVRDPWSASVRGLIRRERFSGYQAAFVSPSETRIECNAAVYRSPAAATEIYRARTSAFAEFAAESNGGRFRFPTIGEESSASRFRLGGSRYYGVTWRFRNVLAGCVSGRWFSRSPVADLQTVARAHQQRIAGVLGDRR
jgi:hypothetical protein